MFSDFSIIIKMEEYAFLNNYVENWIGEMPRACTSLRVLNGAFILTIFASFLLFYGCSAVVKYFCFKPPWRSG